MKSSSFSLYHSRHTGESVSTGGLKIPGSHGSLQLAEPGHAADILKHFCLFWNGVGLRIRPSSTMISGREASNSMLKGEMVLNDE